MISYGWNCIVFLFCDQLFLFLAKVCSFVCRAIDKVFIVQVAFHVIESSLLFFFLKLFTLVKVIPGIFYSLFESSSQCMFVFLFVLF